MKVSKFFFLLLDNYWHDYFTKFCSQAGNYLQVLMKFARSYLAHGKLCPGAETEGIGKVFSKHLFWNAAVSVC